MSLVECVICGKIEETLNSRHPLHGLSGWQYMMGGDLVCSLECQEKHDRKTEAREKRIFAKRRRANE